MTLDLSHLAGTAREQVFQDAKARIRIVRTARWVGFSRAQLAVEELERRYDFPTCARMPCLLLYGNSGMGKTMILDSCCERSNVDIACGTASGAGKPHSLLNINFSDWCSVFSRDGKRGLDQHASQCGSRGVQAI